MIVVWNAIILHCRWGGFIRDRGLIVLALFGNVITAWSWFGVNMLGIGLHSYGFMDEAFGTLKWFALLQMLFMIAAAQPLHNWLSGKHLAKENNRAISVIVAIMMAIGFVLHGVSLPAIIGTEHENLGSILSLLGIFLVIAGLLLSFIPANFTGTTVKKAA